MPVMDTQWLTQCPLANMVQASAQLKTLIFEGVELPTASEEVPNEIGCASSTTGDNECIRSWVAKAGERRLCPIKVINNTTCTIR